MTEGVSSRWDYAQHLVAARARLASKDYKAAFDDLERVLSCSYYSALERDAALPDSLADAATLAEEIADHVEGRMSRRTAKLADHRAQGSRIAFTIERAHYDQHLSRLKANATAFVLLQAADEDSNFVATDSFEPIAHNIREWSETLYPCYSAAYIAVAELGNAGRSDAEQVRVEQLLREIVNEVVLDHATAVRDVGSLRQAAPACLAYAIVRDDIRARELISSLQRHAGEQVEMPADAAMSTAVLDAMEASQTAPADRELFKLVAGAAFHVGVGAAVEDVILDAATADDGE